MADLFEPNGINKLETLNMFNVYNELEHKILSLLDTLNSDIDKDILIEKTKQELELIRKIVSNIKRINSSHNLPKPIILNSLQ